MKFNFIKRTVAGLAIACAAGQAMAVTTYFSEDFSDLAAWNRKSTDSFAQVSGNVLSFTNSTGAGDIYSQQAFTNFYINFEYRGAQPVDGGGYVGVSDEANLSGHTWLASSSATYVTSTPMVNDGNWRSYSVYFAGTGHVMLEQYANSTPGQGQFRNLSVTDVAVIAAAPVPEPETYAMLLVGLGGIGAVARRKKHAAAVDR